MWFAFIWIVCLLVTGLLFPKADMVWDCIPGRSETEKSHYSWLVGAVPFLNWITALIALFNWGTPGVDERGR